MAWVAAQRHIFMPFLRNSNNFYKFQAINMTFLTELESFQTASKLDFIHFLKPFWRLNHLILQVLKYNRLEFSNITVLHDVWKLTSKIVRLSLLLTFLIFKMDKVELSNASETALMADIKGHQSRFYKNENWRNRSKEKCWGTAW